MTHAARRAGIVANAYRKADRVADRPVVLGSDTAPEPDAACWLSFSWSWSSSRARTNRLLPSSGSMAGVSPAHHLTPSVGSQRFTREDVELLLQGGPLRLQHRVRLRRLTVRVRRLRRVPLHVPCSSVDDCPIMSSRIAADQYRGWPVPECRSR